MLVLDTIDAMGENTQHITVEESIEVGEQLQGGRAWLLCFYACSSSLNSVPLGISISGWEYTCSLYG